MIPLVDLKAQYAGIRTEIDAAVARVLEHTGFILGAEVESFERAFAGYCGTRHAIGVASGTSALHLALLACGVRPGDEVITTPLTFCATAEAIVHVGAVPVFVDVDPASGNLDPDRLEAALSPRTGAIIPVHLYGNPANIDGIAAVAAARGVSLIEDAAQAHGAKLAHGRAGSAGAAACFSFYPGKNLGAYGDAGMVTTQDDQVAARIRLLRDHGRRDKYVHEVVGYGERLDALQAAVLGVKLRHLDEWNASRRRLAARYRDHLCDFPLQIVEQDYERSVFHLFAVRVRERDRVLEGLRRRGVGAGVHYPVPLHLQPAFAGSRCAGDVSTAELIAREVLSLPLYPELTEEAQDVVIAALRAAMDEVAPHVP